MKYTFQQEMLIGELDKSIIALSKRKLKILKELDNINQTISFLRSQQEELIESYAWCQSIQKRTECIDSCSEYNQQ